MALKIWTDGSTTPLPDADLATLQAAVGGYIEMVFAGPGLVDQVLVVNEEGLLQGLDLNPTASTLAGQPIVGDAVLCDNNELE